MAEILFGILGVLLQLVPLGLVVFGVLDNLFPRLLFGFASVILLVLLLWRYFSGGIENKTLFFGLLVLLSHFNTLVFSFRKGESREIESSEDWIQVAIFVSVFLVVILMTSLGGEKKVATFAGEKRLFTPLELEGQKACINNFGGEENVRKLAGILDIRENGKSVAQMIGSDFDTVSACDQIIFKLSDIRSKNTRLTNDQTYELANVINNVRSNTLIELINDVSSRTTEAGTLTGIQSSKLRPSVSRPSIPRSSSLRSFGL